MNHKTFRIIVVTGLVLLAAALWTGRAFADTGCFTDTNGHWAETFICWMKNNNISSGYPDGTFRPNNPITRAEVSVLLNKQVELPPTTGLIMISEGAGNWRPQEPGEVILEVKPGATEVKAVTGGTSVLSIHPSLPNVLYGKRMSLAAVQLCFEANPTAYLTHLEFNLVTNVTGTPTVESLWSSDTDRTTSLCTIIGLASPRLLDFTDTVNVFLSVTWTDTLSVFKLGRADFHLLPSATAFVEPWSLSEDLFLLP